jgi:hypothetical protein
MISKNTVLVLGAGASYPYGFPLGKQLKQKILSLQERPDDYSAVHELGYLERDISEFQRRFRGSQLDSIDLFLER